MSQTNCSQFSKISKLFSLLSGAGAGSEQKIPGAGAAPKQAGSETLDLRIQRGRKQKNCQIVFFLKKMCLKELCLVYSSIGVAYLLIFNLLHAFFSLSFINIFACLLLLYFFASLSCLPPGRGSPFDFAQKRKLAKRNSEAKKLVSLDSANLKILSAKRKRCDAKHNKMKRKRIKSVQPTCCSLFMNLNF